MTTLKSGTARVGVVSLRLFACVTVVAASPGLLLAQTPGQTDPSRFGVIVSFGLPSTFQDNFKDLLTDAEAVDIRSQDFEVGFIVRGRALGGDWGVSYIQKGYEDGSRIIGSSESCGSAGCFKSGSDYVFQDVQLRGVSVHKFAPFVTIKKRAQIGLTFGGGVAKARGSADRHDYSVTFQPPNTYVPTETVTQVDAKELFFNDTIPIWKVEVTGAFIVAPGLKVRVGGGLSFANYPAVSISGTYLFGAK